MDNSEANQTGTTPQSLSSLHELPLSLPPADDPNAVNEQSGSKLFKPDLGSEDEENNSNNSEQFIGPTHDERWKWEQQRRIGRHGYMKRNREDSALGNQIANHGLATRRGASNGEGSSRALDGGGELPMGQNDISISNSDDQGLSALGQTPLENELFGSTLADASEPRLQVQDRAPRGQIVNENFGNTGPTTLRRNPSISERHSLYSSNSAHDELTSGGYSPLLPHTSPSQIIRRKSTLASSEEHVVQVIVPRWQADVEVTFCPICRAQFSFFVRKHHCRKCGRVVCNSCSPHRITIPYQYIVQPPTVATSSITQTRPFVDVARAGSSAAIPSAGGGERVRLCNPCVPDPNIAPPQQNQRQDMHHGRSASIATAPYNRGAPLNQFNPSNSQRRPRENSILGAPTYHVSNRAWVSERNQQIGASYSERTDHTLRPEGLEARSRSSTVGSARDPANMIQGNRHSTSGNLSANLVRAPQQSQQCQYRSRSVFHRSEMNFFGPHPPAPRPQALPRRRIPEEDECWVCHKELPSRELPNAAEVREAHTMECINSTIQGNQSTQLAPAASYPARSRNSNSAAAARESSSSTAAPVPAPGSNTPEARTAAREQAHAAVVLGSQQSLTRSSSSRRSGIFRYTATEKDCIDDAECTICLEEFEVGAMMGRLECFCRFHLSCIQDWFVGRPGQCPVHQHGGGY